MISRSKILKQGVSTEIINDKLFFLFNSLDGRNTYYSISLDSLENMGFKVISRAITGYTLLKGNIIYENFLDIGEDQVEYSFQFKFFLYISEEEGGNKKAGINQFTDYSHIFENDLYIKNMFIRSR